MPVDANTLQAFLHQNYTPFCDDIDQCAALCDNISVADSMRPAHEEVCHDILALYAVCSPFSSSCALQWSHATLTDYYTFLITVHGTLLNLPSPVRRDQNRKMKGVVLFQKMKELRENGERVNDIRLAFQEEAQEEEAMTTSTLSDASVTSLVCEVLPLLSKSRPSFLSARVKELVRMPWTASQIADAQMDIEEGEVNASFQEDEAGEAPGRAVRVEAGPLASTGKVRIAARSVTAQPIDLDFDKDDDIEDF